MIPHEETDITITQHVVPCTIQKSAGDRVPFKKLGPYTYQRDIPGEQTDATNRTLMTRVNIDQRSVYILFTLATRFAKRTGRSGSGAVVSSPRSESGTIADKLMH